MLKQQLQKTDEEFDKRFGITHEKQEIPEKTWKLYGELNKFIHQAQIDAVKAFAEEMKKHVNENYSRSSQPLYAHVDAKGVVNKINNILKDI